MMALQFVLPLALTGGNTLDLPMDFGVVAGGPPADTAWTNILAFPILGRGWPAAEMDTPFNRLPSAAQKLLCPASAT
jgi:hypothetical protein